MADLASEELVVLNASSVGLSTDEVNELKPQLPEWTVVNDGMAKLERTYRFDTFASAMAFANKVGNAADEVDHHPELTTTWGRTTVRWWTHSLGGLSRNDFIMAAKTDAISG